MPSPLRESRPPQDIAMQITLGQWLVAASGGLIAARAGRSPEEAEKAALSILRDALVSAADQDSLAAVSSELGLVSAREAAYLVDAVGADAAPALRDMAAVLERATEGKLTSEDESGFRRVQQLLLSLSELRLAQARRSEYSDSSEPPWPTTLSSGS